MKKKWFSALYEELLSDVDLSGAKLELFCMEENAFVGSIKKTAENLGVKCVVTTFYQAYNGRMTASNQIYKEIKSAVRLGANGVLLVHPFPDNLDIEFLELAIPPMADIDCVNPISLGKLYKQTAASGIMNMSNHYPHLMPAVCSACMEIFKKLQMNLRGASVCLVGSGKIGKPLATILLNAGATVTVCNEWTINLSEYTRNSHIVISATGIPHLLTKDMISQDAIVLDVGFSTKDGKMYGDVEDVKHAFVSPVPGGVGKVTTACLFKNLYHLMEG